MMVNGNVLIATNDEPLGEYLYHQINGFGWAVSRTSQFTELLRRIKEREADVLVLDFTLEEIPSLDLLPLIKKAGPEIPVIALSEDSSLEMSRRVRLQGIFFLAMKPIDPAEVRTAVGDAIKMLNEREQRRSQNMNVGKQNMSMGKVIPFNTLERVKDIFAEHEGKKGHLLIVLQKIQAIYGYVPPFTLEMVSQVLGVTTSEIYGVLTFYNRFHLNPQGRHTVRVCRGTACHFKGAPSLIEAVRNRLQLPHGKETTEDFLFSLEEVSCLGACGISPVMTIDEETYGNLSPGMAVEIIARYEAEEKAPAVPEVAAEEKKAA
jgi:NADH-quinone oxidoreductase subunit E